MKVSMANLVDPRLLGRGKNDEVVVLVASGVHLVRGRHQLNKNEEAASHVAAGRVSEVGVGFEKGACHRFVITAKFALIRRLKLLPNS